MLPKMTSGAGNSGGRRLWRKEARRSGSGARTRCRVHVGRAPGQFDGPVATASTDPSCTFSANGQSGVGNETKPFLLTGLDGVKHDQRQLHRAAGGAIPATVQASPLAVVTQPFSLSLLGSEADLNSSQPSAQPTERRLHRLHEHWDHGGGDLHGRWNSRWHQPSPPTPTPNVLPRKPQINAGLLTCVIAVGNLTGADDGSRRHALPGGFPRPGPP